MQTRICKSPTRRERKRAVVFLRKFWATSNRDSKGMDFHEGTSKPLNMILNEQERGGRRGGWVDPEFLGVSQMQQNTDQTRSANSQTGKLGGYGPSTHSTPV